MSLALTKEGNLWSLSNNFLKWFANYKEGLWKRKYTDLFFKMLRELKPSIPTFIKNKNKSGYFKNEDIKDTPGENDQKINYAKYFIFVYICVKFFDFVFWFFFFDCILFLII